MKYLPENLQLKQADYAHIIRNKQKNQNIADYRQSLLDKACDQYAISGSTKHFDSILANYRGQVYDLQNYWHKLEIATEEETNKIKNEYGLWLLEIKEQLKKLFMEGKEKSDKTIQNYIRLYRQIKIIFDQIGQGEYPKLSIENANVESLEKLMIFINSLKYITEPKNIKNEKKYEEQHEIYYYFVDFFLFY